MGVAAGKTRVQEFDFSEHVRHGCRRWMRLTRLRRREPAMLRFQLCGQARMPVLHLKDQFNAELDIAWQVGLAGDFAKVRVGRIENRVIELGVVKSIQEFAA